MAHQLFRVLRLRKGDRILVCDGSGWEYEVEIVGLSHDGGSGTVRAKSRCRSEPKLRINLFQSLLKGEKFDWVLQKGTELGISGFFPVVSRRCISTGASPHKLKRWRRIIREAAEQSGRGKLPALAEPLPLERACLNLKGLSLIPWEKETERGLKQVLPPDRPRSVNIFIGPEGGFEPEEVSRAQKYGIIPVRLGPRTLRAETAGLAAASAILYHYGELG